MAFGRSSLGRSEAHVLLALDAFAALLNLACGSPAVERVAFPTNTNLFE
jgi:hypothetical protein